MNVIADSYKLFTLLLIDTKAEIVVLAWTVIVIKLTKICTINWIFEKE